MRHWIVLALISVPNAAMAEVCDKMCPGWTPGTPATMLDEALHLFSSGPALVLLLATVITVLRRSSWGGFVVVLLWTAYATVLVMLPPFDVELAAQAEGCIGSPALFIGTVIAICGAMILYTAPRPGPDKP